METRLLIRGEQVAGEGEPLAVENPATEETGRLPARPSREQLDAAIAAATEAFPVWAGTPAVERAELLTRWPRACGRRPTSWRAP